MSVYIVYYAHVLTFIIYMHMYVYNIAGWIGKRIRPTLHSLWVSELFTKVFWKERKWKLDISKLYGVGAAEVVVVELRRELLVE